MPIHTFFGIEKKRWGTQQNRDFPRLNGMLRGEKIELTQSQINPFKLVGILCERSHTNVYMPFLTHGSKVKKMQDGFN